jgi:hypothetical protein
MTIVHLLGFETGRRAFAKAILRAKGEDAGIKDPFKLGLHVRL